MTGPPLSQYITVAEAEALEGQVESLTRQNELVMDELSRVKQAQEALQKRPRRVKVEKQVPAEDDDRIEAAARFNDWYEKADG